MADPFPPLVSIIIPNYNQTRYLVGAIRSALSQRYKNFEIILVDDGSTEDCRAVIEQFNSRVQYIRQENQGLASARNAGLRASTGEWVGLLDADDEWRPDFLEEMMRLAIENPNATVLYCEAQCMDVEGRELPQVVGGPSVEPEALYQKLVRANFIIPSTVVFRRKPIIEAGSFDASLRSCEDWDLWLRLLPSASIIGSPKRLVCYRVHNESLSSNVKGMHDAARRVVEKHFGIDDGDPSTWLPEKRRAFGGLYRYQAITFIQRQKDWMAAAEFLSKSLRTDPSLALDLDYFYELGLGSQPVGLRGASIVEGLDENMAQVGRIMRDKLDHPDVRHLRKRALGTAEFALGLLAYSSGKQVACRAYFVHALINRPNLIFDRRLVGSYIKSFFNKDALTTIKKLARRNS